MNQPKQQSTEVPEQEVEALAKKRWNRGHLEDDQADWDTAKQMGLPGVRAALGEASADLEAAAPALRNQGAEEERERLKEALGKAIGRLREVTPNQVHKASVNLRRQVASELEELAALTDNQEPS